MNERVVKASIKWWESHRPVTWTFEEHLLNPQVNTDSDSAGELAEAVAEYLINSIQLHRMLDT